MPRIYLKTMGCQMNDRDSEAVAAQFIARGHSLVDDEFVADAVLLNTCTVRDSADQKALGKMRAIAGNVRRRRPKVILGILGCMAQARGKHLFEVLPELDLVVGTQKFHRTVQFVEELIQGPRRRICEIAEESGSHSLQTDHLAPSAGQERPVSAYVSIMQGCNQNCTFCIVPATRGQERSRAIADLVTEAQQLINQGIKEITMLGQIVTSYGRRDMPERDGQSPFVQLLEAIHEIQGLERIRFTSPHPKGYGDDLVAAYGRLPKLCESAHIPIQSGSNRILKLMHRGYTRERFLEVVEKLRRVKPGMGVATDLIVGFPGETDADFEATMDLVKQVKFDNVFLFRYSPRHGTPAAELPDQIPLKIKESRHAQLLTLINEIAVRKYQPFVGTQVEVLVEGPSRKNSARMTGRTRCNKVVLMDGPPELQGKLLPVRIERASKCTLYGAVVEKS